MKRETVGKISSDLKQKEAPTQSPIELEQEMHRDYEKNVYECIERSKKDFDGDFYVVVLTKREKLMDNVLRHYFLGRQSCPTPDYDQTVYHFHRDGDDLEYLWVIPDKESCQMLYANKAIVDPSEYELLDCVLRFMDGTLLREAKKRNKERADSNIIEA